MSQDKPHCDTAAPTNTAAPDISVVVIGRNEGQRLRRCLESVARAHWGGLRHELVYVDSNSSDASPALAAALGARVLGLGTARPCAAAGRNIGWRAAQAPLILFLDGDTVLDPGFVALAVRTLAEPRIVAVWGHRRELDPKQSIYTRVLDLDWVFAPGRVAYFGGDVLVRRQALADVDGFDDTQVAGEEPELCQRLRARGWEIEHIDAPMTGHDLALRTFSAYWRRAERAGLAYAQVSARFALSPDPLWRTESRDNLIRGSAIATLPVLLLAAALLQPWLAVALLGAVLALLLRSARRALWKCPGEFNLALCYAVHSQLQHVPILVGQLRYRRMARRQEAPALMEYKGPPPAQPPGDAA